MKEYFTGHRDSVRINEFQNGHSEDSQDFQIVYRLRRMGGWPFYKALCVITQEGALLTPLEQRIREEIVHPSFCKPMPKGAIPRVWYKL